MKNYIKKLPIPICYLPSYKYAMELEIDPNYVPFKSDGWYYNRITKENWVEYNNIKYICPSRDVDFLLELSLFNHNPLREDDTKALKILVRDRIANKDMRELYLLDDHWKELKNIRYESRKWMRSMIYGNV